MSIRSIPSGVVALGFVSPLMDLSSEMVHSLPPVFPLAGHGHVDRAARDAIVADLTPPHLRGAAYGLRQSMDRVGAFAGPLAAMAVMATTFLRRGLCRRGADRVLAVGRQQ